MDVVTSSNDVWGVARASPIALRGFTGTSTVGLLNDMFDRNCDLVFLDILPNKLKRLKALKIWRRRWRGRATLRSFTGIPGL